MKLLTISLFALMLFASCDQQESMFQVCETGEKLKLHNDIYSVGDTVVLIQKVDQLGESVFEIDHNWIKFPGSYKYLEDIGFYKAVVIK